MEEEVKKPVNIPRTFWSKAYLKELDLGVFGLFRDWLVEGTDPKTGEKFKEKMGKPVGPIKVLREAKQGEEKEVVLRTFHPTENRPIDLVEVQ